MKIVSVYTANDHLVTIKNTSPVLRNLIVLNSAINSNANIMYDDKLKKEISKGSQSEVCILNFLRDEGEQY